MAEIPALLAQAREVLSSVGFLTCLDFAEALGWPDSSCSVSIQLAQIPWQSSLHVECSPLPTLSWCAVLLWAAEQLPLPFSDQLSFTGGEK